MKIAVFVLIAVSIIFAGCSKSPATTVTKATTTSISVSISTSKTTSSTIATGLSRASPIPMGQSLIVDGISITVTKLNDGVAAWDIIHSLNEFNEVPAADMRYVLITLNVSNISSSTEPYDIYYPYFTLIGSSNVEYKSSDKPVVLAENGDYHELNATLSHGGQTRGSISYYIKQNETDLVIVSSLGNTKRYFEVK